MSFPIVVYIVIVISLWFMNNCKLCADSRNKYRIVVGKPGGKRLLGRPRQRREDNIKIDLPKVGCGGTDWIKLTQNRDRWQALVKAIMNLRAP